MRSVRNLCLALYFVSLFATDIRIDVWFGIGFIWYFLYTQVDW